MAAAYIDTFKKHLEGFGVIDPEGVHHEFVSGTHGRKIDFDAIPTDDPLFEEWIEVIATYIKETFPDSLDDIGLVSVANGTNRVVPLVAEKLGPGASYFLTEKQTSKSVRLESSSESALREKQPGLILVLEDVGTQGTTSASAVEKVRELGFTNIRVINTWQRQKTLVKLDEINVPYSAIIVDILDTFSPDDCTIKGYCAEGWEFITHD